MGFTQVFGIGIVLLVGLMTINSYLQSKKGKGDSAIDLKNVAGAVGGGSKLATVLYSGGNFKRLLQHQQMIHSGTFQKIVPLHMK